MKLMKIMILKNLEEIRAFRKMNKTKQIINNNKIIKIHNKVVHNKMQILHFQRKLKLKMITKKIITKIKTLQQFKKYKIHK